MADRRRAILIASLVAILVFGLGAWLALHSSTYLAPTPVGAAEQVDTTAAAAALRRLVEAIDDRDADAAATVAPVADQQAQDALRALVANAGALDVTDVALRYVDSVGGRAQDGSWVAAVDLTWRFAGFDRRVAHSEVRVGFAPSRTSDQASAAKGVAITGFAGGAQRTPLWLTGPIEVRRSPHTLVLAAGPAGVADDIAESAERAVGVVGVSLPRWRGRLVVEVPASEAGLDVSLGTPPGTYRSIAAVTASVDGATDPDAEIHIFLNPTLYAELDPIGAQVVMSHEATHVATRAPLRTGVPLWLLEGFADYVALRDVDLPIGTTAGQIISQVNRDGVPQALPGPTEFDETATHLGASYESAWVACMVLAEVRGDDALVELYRRVSATGDLIGPLRTVMGLSEQQLTERWRERLRTLAAGAADGT